MIFTKKKKPFFETYSLIAELSKCFLFDFHIFGNMPIVFLLLISSREYILYNLNDLNLLRFVLWSLIWFTLVNIHGFLGKNMYPAFVRKNVQCM